MRFIDLNCDCGEGFGPFKMGDDAAMLEIVTSASIACGFHAGDFDIMGEIYALAGKKGVAIGAHPGFPDLWGFGRRPLALTAEQIERCVAYQIGAAQALARLARHRISYVKPHGALSNLAMADLAIAKAIARAVKSVEPCLQFLAIAGTKLEEAGLIEGLVTVREIYADRSYTDEGQLMSRALPGAVLHNSIEISDRMLEMVEQGQIITVSGKRLPVGIDSICVHGDTPEAVTIAKTLRQKLAAAGIVFKPFSAP